MRDDLAAAWPARAVGNALWALILGAAFAGAQTSDRHEAQDPEESSEEGAAPAAPAKVSDVDATISGGGQSLGGYGMGRVKEDPEQDASKSVARVKIQAAGLPAGESAGAPKGCIIQSEPAWTRGLGAPQAKPLLWQEGDVDYAYPVEAGRYWQENLGDQEVPYRELLVYGASGLSMYSASTTPCDFSCKAEALHTPEQARPLMVLPADSPANFDRVAGHDACRLKPGKTIYLNVRFPKGCLPVSAVRGDEPVSRNNRCRYYLYY